MGEPQIGIFWLTGDLQKIAVTAKQNVSEVNTIVNIGKFFYSSHEKRWEELKKQGALGEHARMAFDYLPRGTVSFVDKFDKYFITGGEWLNEDIKRMVINEFTLPENVDFMIVPGVLYDYHH